MIKKESYIERRNRLKQRVTEGLILLPANHESPFTSLDCTYPFRQDSTFLYFTGIDKPELYFLIDSETGEETLFGNENSSGVSFWGGRTLSLSDLCQKSGIEHHAPLESLDAVIDKAANSGRKVHYPPPYQAGVLLKLMELLKAGRKELAEQVSDELIKAIVALRSIKDEHEIKEIEAAIKITSHMHSTALIMVMPGAFERDIKGVLEGIAISRGGAVAFQPIITIRGDVLHNPNYVNTLENGRFLVADIGAESSNHYASDITRTIPVGRSFTRLQRNIYEIVLKANLEAIEAVQPHIPFREIHLKAARVIVEGLKALGIMKGDPQEAVQAGAHALFFPHGLGHMMGLDVHDMECLGEDYVGYSDSYPRSSQFGLNRLRLAKPLEAGHVVTIEPGIYFIESLIDRWRQEGKHKDFINYDQIDPYLGLGGVRLEDDILVTESGHQVLGPPIPKSIKEIESF